eukprot:CAMPEP_0115133610 /NCGR_PEP_ID=MMETSP0227-20121206/54553_1 /TAXON_ID=89957 /ORGANISM="Polarella glacialis, Strain CCMP 1383" /LENGTH=57 /DNA_ID=CAMNT_0002539831 /DNA_START=115 /DNA_END=288 /DNA_ORIENTATION=+
MTSTQQCVNLRPGSALFTIWMPSSGLISSETPLSSRKLMTASTPESSTLFTWYLKPL